MNKITYLSSKRLNLTALAAIISLATLSLTVPLSVNNRQTASFHNLQSSFASVKNQLVNASVKAIENGDRLIHARGLFNILYVGRFDRRLG